MEGHTQTPTKAEEVMDQHLDQHLIDVPIAEVFDTAVDLMGQVKEPKDRASTYAIITLALSVRLLAKAVTDSTRTFIDVIQEDT